MQGCPEWMGYGNSGRVFYLRHSFKLPGHDDNKKSYLSSKRKGKKKPTYNEPSHCLPLQLSLPHPWGMSLSPWTCIFSSLKLFLSFYLANIFIALSMCPAYSQCFNINQFNPSNNLGRKVFVVFFFYSHFTDEETRAQVYTFEKKQNQVFNSGNLTPENILCCLSIIWPTVQGWRYCVQSGQLITHIQELLDRAVLIIASNIIFIN